MSAGFRPLLKKGNAWVWEKEHEEEFNKIKILLTSPTIAVVRRRKRNNTADRRIQATRTRIHARAKKQEGRTLADSVRISVTHTDTTVLRNNRVRMPGYRMGHTKMGLLPTRTSAFYIWTDHRPLVGIFDKVLAAIENAHLMRIREK